MGIFHHRGHHGHGCRPAGFEGIMSFMTRGGGPEHGGPFGGRGPRGGRGGDGFRMGRMVADGDLRLIVLSLLEKQPRHGYDIIKAIEELTSGSYSPSPGVIYPTLTFLEEGGHVASVSEGNKKVYSITEAGLGHLQANRVGVDAVLDHLARIGRRMAEAKAWFGREDEDRRGPKPDRDIPGVIAELNDARRTLKAAIAAAIGSSEDEQHRIAEILAKAAAAINAKPDDPVDL